MFSKVSTQKNYRSALVLSLCLTLAACGFHLRGMLSLPASMQKLTVLSLSNDSPLVPTLTSALQVAGVDVVPPGQAPFTLTILTDDFTSSIGSISASTNTRQYSLSYRVSIQLNDKDGTIVIAPSTLQTYRTLTVDANMILGSNSQEFTLKQEMREDIVQKVLAQIASKQTKARIEALPTKK